MSVSPRNASRLPLGAIVAREGSGLASRSHASTFGGNRSPAARLSHAPACRNRYRANAERRGTELRAGLLELAGHHPGIREVRGIGLMIGVELHVDGSPAPALRDMVIDHAFRRGLLLLPCGQSTVRFSPPLCLTGRQVRTGLDLFDAALFAAFERDAIETN